MAKANTEYIDAAVLQMMTCNCCGRTASMPKYCLTPIPLRPHPLTNLQRERGGVITAKS